MDRDDVDRIPNGRMLPDPVSESSTTMALSVTEDWLWTETECSQDEHNGLFEALAMTFGIAIFVTNLIVVAAIKRGGRKLHKATFYCICNLAVADMLAGLLLLWIFGLQRVVLPFRTAESELVQKSIWTLTVWTSLLSQVVIAIDRHSHVTRGSKGNGSFSNGCNKWGNKQRKRMIVLGILLTWLIPTVTYVVPVMTVWNCADNCSCHIRDNKTEVLYMRCLPLSTCSQVNPPFAKSSMLFISLILLILPFVPVFLYVKIFVFVRNSSKNLRSSCKNNHIVASASNTENTWNKKRDESGEGLSKDESSGSKTEAFVTQDDDGALQCHHAANGTSSSEIQPRKSWRGGYLAGQAAKSKSKKTSGGSIGDSVNEYNHDERRLRELSGKSSISKGTLCNNPLRKRNQRRDMRLLRTLVIILALFVISTVPLGLLFLVSVTETDKRYVQPAKYLLTLSLLNSLVNPWVYFWRFREMRSAIRRLFCSPCTSDRKLAKRQDKKTCTCCHLPGGKKLHFFSSTHSSKKVGSSSSSSAF